MTLLVTNKDGFGIADMPVKHAGEQPFITVLGIAQDAGYPHPGCKKMCCGAFYSGAEKKHFVSCLALLDPVSGQRWLFDCTPDFTTQLHALDTIFPVQEKILDGIFLTHAHTGHYTGLMYLGRESLNTKQIPVYATPDFNSYLTNNGPWSQLVSLKNIQLTNISPDSTIHLNNRISITPFLVPHRHEFSVAVGYKIAINGKSVIFIPDIDKWNKWNRDIIKIVKESDLVFIDGTFFKNGEIAGRDMSEIPHPFIEESMELFKNLSNADKAKIHFIHLNHTNPAIQNGSDAQKEIREFGFNMAREGEKYSF